MRAPALLGGLVDGRSLGVARPGIRQGRVASLVDGPPQVEAVGPRGGGRGSTGGVVPAAHLGPAPAPDDGERQRGQRRAGHDGRADPEPRRRGAVDVVGIPSSAKSSRSAVRSAERRPTTAVTTMPTDATSAEGGDDPADAAAGDQQDAPAGEHDQRRGRRPAAPWPPQWCRRASAADPLSALRDVAAHPGPVAGDGGEAGRGERRAGRPGRSVGAGALSHRRPAARRRRSRCGRRCGRPGPPGRP